MAGDLDGTNPTDDERSRLRVSDAERHRVSELLREAAGEGRLDIDELEERLEAAYAAKTYADLVPLTVDLPVAGQLHNAPPSQPDPVEPSGVAVRYDTSLAILGASRRIGVWEVGPAHTAFALMGGVDIDLRQARFSAHETVIHAYSFWGGIDIYVNARTRVVVDGVGVLGSFEQTRDRVEADLGPDSPLVRVDGLAVMSGITVQRRPMPGERKRRRLGHGS